MPAHAAEKTMIPIRQSAIQESPGRLRDVMYVIDLNNVLVTSGACQHALLLRIGNDGAWCMRYLPNKIMCALLVSLITAFAQAQPLSYPARPVRVIVPVPAGGGHDLIARIVMIKLGEVIGMPFVIDNRAGAGQIIGADIVAKATPDGYTLLFAASGYTIAPFMYPHVPYDVRKDFALVTRVGSQPLLLAVNTQLAANTVPELINMAKAKPDALKLALATPGSSGAVAG